MNYFNSKNERITFYTFIRVRKIRLTPFLGYDLEEEVEDEPHSHQQDEHYVQVG